MFLNQHNGELTSAAVLLREQPGFYEKPQISRRLVKRLVIFLDKLEINSIIQLYYKLPLWFRPRARGHLGGPCFYEL